MVRGNWIKPGAVVIDVGIIPVEVSSSQASSHAHSLYLCHTRHLFLPFLVLEREENTQLSIKRLMMNFIITAMLGAGRDGIVHC